MTKITLKLKQVCIGKRKPKCRYVPYNVNKRMHWATRSKWKKAWEEEVGWAVYEKKKELKQITGKKHIQVKIKTCRLQDKDNLYGSAKPIFDGLVYAKVIEDDSPDHIESEVIQEKVNHLKDQGVEITISKYK